MIEQRLHDCRRYLRLRQQTVADYMGMKRQSYAAIENGTRKLTVAEMVMLCNLFRVTPNNLLDIKTER